GLNRYIRIAANVAGTTYSDEGLTGGISYSYAVAAVRTDTGEGEYSASAQATPLALTVQVPTLDSISAELEALIQAGDIRNGMSSQLVNRIRQAERFMEQGETDKVVHHLNLFLEHLNNQALADRITESARSVLDSDIRALAAAL